METDDTPGFHFVGNLLCLDLVNTEAMSQGRRTDLLRGYGDLVAWLRRAGVLDDAGAEADRRREGTGEADDAMRHARALRGALREMARSLVDGEAVGDGALRAINEVLALRPAIGRVERTAEGFALRTQPLTEGAAQLLAPVAESAAWLLEHGDRALLKRCENPQCILYFYDTTKNHSRRWCSMDGCGSRHKAAAYYRRRGRGAAAPARPASPPAEGEAGGGAAQG
jgi:predicted RNA-binding Zn ribbon-like protein